MVTGHEVTETWKEKNYEYELTELFFQTARRMGLANQEPNIKNFKLALSSVMAFSNALIYNKKYRGEYENIVKPVLKDINTIIYGNYKTAEVNTVCRKYNVHKKMGKFKQIEITNIPSLLSELWEAFHLLKQWAYEMGFFAKKPWDQQHGRKAIGQVFET